MAKSSKQAPPEAMQVLQAFLDANLRNDKAAMKACLSSASLKSGQWESLPPRENFRFVFGEARQEGDLWIIDVEGGPEGAPGEGPPATTLPCVMLREGTQWKFDLDESINRVMAGLETVMNEAASAMAKTMETIGETMAKGLSEAFGDNSPQASPAPAPEEFLPLAEMVPLPKAQAALSKAVGSPVIAQAAIKDLVQQSGTLQAGEITKLLEGQLLAGLPKILAAIGKAMPLKNRLRALRIEAAFHTENRMLAIDGSDLVYRMLLPYNEGFFQDDQIAAMLPGVLAGLPETIDPAVAGHRLLPMDEELVDLNLYQERIAPRWMERIEHLLEWPVTLDADWTRLGRFQDSGRVLSLWGLNRVWGAIAYACQSPARRKVIAEQLSVIKIVLAGMDSDRCYARFENRTLELGVKAGAGSWEIGFYEHEIAQALPAEPQQPSAPPDKPQKRPRRKK